MITKFKLYEEMNNGDPQIGDYAIIYKNNCFNIDYFDGEIQKFYKFVNNNIGIIINITDNYIRIKYQNIPENILIFFDENLTLNAEKKVVIYAGTKNNLEMKLSAKNFNL